MQGQNTRSALPIAWILLLGALAALIVFAPREQPGPETETGSVTFRTADILTDEESQRRRTRFIDSLKQHRFIDSIEGGSPAPVVYVGGSFAMTPDHRKATNLGSVFGYLWILDNRVTHLVLRDPASGHDLGRFGEAGLELFGNSRPLQ